MKIKELPWSSTSVQFWGTEDFARTYRRVWLPYGNPTNEVFRVEYIMTMQAEGVWQARAPGQDLLHVESLDGDIPRDSLGTVTQGDIEVGVCEGSDAGEGPWVTREEVRAFTAFVLRYGASLPGTLPHIPEQSVFQASLTDEGRKVVNEHYYGWTLVCLDVCALAVNERGCVFSVKGVVCRSLSNGTRVSQSFCFLCFTGLPLWLKDVESTGPCDVWGVNFDKARRPGGEVG